MNNVEIGKTGEIKENLPLPDGYIEDGRLPIRELYKIYDKLVEEHGWIKEEIFVQVFEIETTQGKREIKLPIYSYKTPKNEIRDKGFGVIIAAGVHGEESAGPNAIAQEIEYLAKLGERNRVAIIPICNPKGYFLDWRYPDKRRRTRKDNHSVGDTEWLLPSLDMSGPRKPEAKGNYYLPEAKALGLAIVRLCQEIRPDLSLDLHEDECLKYLAPYIYSQGKMGVKDPIAKKVVRILEEFGLKVIKEGETEFGEDIINGIVDSPNDGSIDELFAAEKVFIDGQWVIKPAVFSAIVVETPTIIKKIPRKDRLPRRKAAHAEVLLHLEQFFQMANSFNFGGM